MKCSKFSRFSNLSFHSVQDLRDRIKMLAVGDENEDPMMASSGALSGASEASSSSSSSNGVVSGSRLSAPLNQVSNHSSVSSGFGSAGSVASPNSSYVTAHNTDDSSGENGIENHLLTASPCQIK